MSQDQLTVIALTGKAESGKDAVAKFLEAHAGFQPLALADGIREALNSLDGRTWAYRKERDAHDMSDRKAMQVMGTECREDLDCERLWLDLLAVKVRYATRYHPVPHHRFVVPDLRYLKEDRYLAEVVGRMRGHYELWRVARPSQGAIAESGHSSEREVDSIPCTRLIWNDGTLEDLGVRALQCLGLAMAGAA